MRWLGYFIAFNLTLIAFTLLVLWGATDLFTDSGMSIHGWIAMFLGISLTSALGVGLMALVFPSNRGPRDEDVHHAAMGRRDDWNTKA